MSALDPPKSKPLVVRLSPQQKLENELRRQLKDRGVLINEKTSLRLDVSRRSTLETYLWRDIQYFLEQEYSESTAVNRAIDRLRENALFIDTVEELVQYYTESAENDG